LITNNQYGPQCLEFKKYIAYTIISFRDSPKSRNAQKPYLLLIERDEDEKIGSSHTRVRTVGIFDNCYGYHFRLFLEKVEVLAFSARLRITSNPPGVSASRLVDVTPHASRTRRKSPTFFTPRARFSERRVSKCAGYWVVHV